MTQPRAELTRLVYAKSAQGDVILIGSGEALKLVNRVYDSQYGRRVTSDLLRVDHQRLEAAMRSGARVWSVNVYRSDAEFWKLQKKRETDKLYVLEKLFVRRPVEKRTLPGGSEFTLEQFSLPN